MECGPHGCGFCFEVSPCVSDPYLAGELAHSIAPHLLDLSDTLASVGSRNIPLALRPGRSDEARHNSAPDPRQRAAVKPTDIYSPDLPLEAIGITPRNFRLDLGHCCRLHRFSLGLLFT